jgi:uncharacterized repeat protein (TIGR01451 family)
MRRRSEQCMRRWAGRLVVLLVAVVSAGLLPVGLSTAAAAPQPSAGPQLSIAVDNGLTAVAKGDALDYTVTIHNLGTKKVVGLRVTQTMPAGMSFRSADSRGTAKAGTVGWRVDVKAGGQISLHSKAVVTKTPDSLLRLATVACASVTAKGAPIVCASHSDVLPAGAAAAAASVADASRSSSSLLSMWWLWLLAVVVLAGAATLLVVRRHRAIPA